MRNSSLFGIFLGMNPSIHSTDTHDFSIFDKPPVPFRSGFEKFRRASPIVYFKSLVA